MPPALLPTAAAAPGSPAIVALHGEDDDLLPIEPTRQSVRALTELGYSVELVPFAKTAHRMSAPEQHELLARVTQAVRAMSAQTSAQTSAPGAANRVP